MIWRRIVYILGLLAALGFYIFHTGYYSWVLLIVAIAFLPMELLLSLPGMLTSRLQLAVREEDDVNDVNRADEILPGFTLHAAVESKFSVCSVHSGMICENLFSGNKFRTRVCLPAAGPVEYHIQSGETLESDPCGVIRFLFIRPRVLDAVGLCAFPVRSPAPVLLMLHPPFPANPPKLPEEALGRGTLPDQSTSRKGPDAMREFSDIREFRQGDTMRDVHWKLSAKLDKFMVKEGSFSNQPSPNLCFDFFGGVETASLVLGRVEVLSRQLSIMERLHGIHWLDAGDVLQSRYIADPTDFDTILWELLSTRLPAEGNPIRESLPNVLGPVLLVDSETISLYEHGALKEVHA